MVESCSVSSQAFALPADQARECSAQWRARTRATQTTTILFTAMPIKNVLRLVRFCFFRSPSRHLKNESVYYTEARLQV